MNLRKIVASTVILPMLFIGSVSAKVNQDTLSKPVGVSEADCQHMQHLVDLGIVQLPIGCRDVKTSKFTREQMTILTLQALYRLEWVLLIAVQKVLIFNLEKKIFYI